MKPTHAALLIGSPRGASSTSNALATFLGEKLQERGVAIEKVFISRCLGSDKSREEMFQLVDNSDLIILAFPLYVDSLQSQVVKTLELIAEHEKGRQPGRKSFVAISNSGFPEARHNNTALAVCRIFARQVGYKWAGGLAMGGGGIISGLPLEKVGGRVRNQTKALEIAAESLAQGDAIPEKAVTLMSKLGIPRWMYIWMGNRGWKSEAKKLMDIKKMYNQPCNEVRANQLGNA